VIDSVNPERTKTPQRRAVVAAHPIRAKILADLAQSSTPLATEDLIIATGEAGSTVKYHLGVLAEVGWVESGPPEAPGVSIPAAVRSEL
jgi:DNA-binding transcriptional ArsR family regulator